MNLQERIAKAIKDADLVLRHAGSFCKYKLDEIKGLILRDGPEVAVPIGLIDKRLKLTGEFGVLKYATDEDKINGRDPYEIIDGQRQLQTTLGIGALLDLFAGTGTPTAFNNANAYLGVGDTATAPAAGQTDLAAATGASHRQSAAMDGGFPSRTGTTTTWQADFTNGQANFQWNEEGVFNAAFASGGTGANAGIMYARLNTSLGTKVSGTWTLKYTMTLS